MIGNSPYDRDELLVTGIPPVAEPLTRPLTQPRTQPLTQAAAEPRPVTEPEPEPMTEAAPVFVDASGGRARLGRRLGLLAGALLLVFLGALGLGMTTGTSVPLTPWSQSSAHPRVKLSRPQVAPTKKPESPAATRRAVPPPAPLVPSEPSAAPERTPSPAPSTSHPGRSQASPPAWGRKKKNG